jgi:hypothetical protein
MNGQRPGFTQHNLGLTPPHEFWKQRITQEVHADQKLQAMVTQQNDFTQAMLGVSESEAPSARSSVLSMSSTTYSRQAKSLQDEYAREKSARERTERELVELRSSMGRNDQRLVGMSMREELQQLRSAVDRQATSARGMAATISPKNNRRSWH